jgi:N-acyl-D-amino-acid deacylase
MRFLCLLLGLACTLAAQGVRYDLVIANGRIYDGTGNPWFVGDVAVAGDAIVAIGKLPPHTAGQTIDARGLAVSPGFVDTHSHARRGIFAVPTAENVTRQGVTTLIEGPDGGSPLPLKAFLDKLRATPIAVNFGSMVGHGTVRGAVMGSQNRKATAAELQKMKEIVRQAMLDGAFGMSTGLFYVPGNYAPTEEVIELEKVVSEFGGVHTSHVRNEAEGVLDSARETIRIGEEGGVPTQHTHVKVVGGKQWGWSDRVIALFDDARRRGVDATLDQYPYTASSTGTAAMFPQWSMAGGAKALRERLAAPETRAKIKAQIVDVLRDGRGAGDAKNVVMAACGFDPKLAGKSLAELTRAAGREPTLENAAETAIEIQMKGGCSAIYHAMDEADVERFLRAPYTMVASDGEVMAPGSNVPHPRSYGTFARVLGRYVRERRTITLEEAVRKMSSFPAARFGLHDRGLLRPGMKADIAVFDPATVGDTATFVKPHSYATGFRHVVVNGKAVILDGKLTAARPGRVLYGPGWVGGAQR